MKKAGQGILEGGSKGRHVTKQVERLSRMESRRARDRIGRKNGRAKRCKRENLAGQVKRLLRCK
jgi:hypothetical protein